MKIGSTTTNQLLGIALSSSQVSFCSVVEGSDVIRLVDLPELNTSSGRRTDSSLSWNDTKLAASTQSSSLVVCDVRNDSSSIEVVHQIENAHQLLGENVQYGSPRLTYMIRTGSLVEVMTCVENVGFARKWKYRSHFFQ